MSIIFYLRLLVVLHKSKEGSHLPSTQLIVLYYSTL
jgi:hypothetical protein